MRKSEEAMVEILHDEHVEDFLRNWADEIEARDIMEWAQDRWEDDGCPV